MPYYDGIGVIAEKNAVVLDMGFSFTKVGYAGEPVPRAIVRTPTLATNIDDDSLHDTLVSFVHRLYFDYLLVNPKDRRVVLIEALIGEVRFRDALVQVLFLHFEVLSILLAPSHLMPLFALGLQHGLVLDVGYKEATLIPVYENVPILKSWQALPLAAEAVHQRIRKDISTNGTISQGGNGDYAKVSDSKVAISESVIEDIKIRLCFVTDIARGQRIQQIKNDASSVSGLSTFLNQSVPAATYPLDGDTILRVDGQMRESVMEVLFEQDNDRTSCSTMILDALLSCPIDTRRELAGNIILIGGTTMLIGFKARLFQEIRHLLQCPPYKDKIIVNADDFKLHICPGKANFAAWTGASIFGATDAVVTRSFTREFYFKERAVPDWSNLKFNSVYNKDRYG